MGYSTQFFAGVGWSGLLKVASKALTLMKIAILARILSPNDFGLFSLVLVTLSIVEVFAETGINIMLIQSKKPLSYFLSTAWVISIARGFIIAMIMLAMAIPLQLVYQESMLLPLIALASLVPILRGFINPAIVTLHKEMRFRADTSYRFTLVVSDVVLSVLLSLIIGNVFALILSIVAQAVLDVALSYALTTLRPKFQYTRSVAREIFQHMRWLNGVGVLDYLTKNLDDLIIGRALGVSTLGLYRNAYALTQSTTAELGLVVIHATFPVFVQMNNDLERLRRAFAKVVISFGGAVLIPTIILMLFPAEIVRIVLGSEWSMIIPIVPVLALAGYIQGLLNIGYNMLVAQARYRWVISILAASLIVMIVTVVPLSMRYGLTGAAWSIALSRIVALPFYVFAILASFQINHEKKDH